MAFFPHRINSHNWLFCFFPPRTPQIQITTWVFFSGFEHKIKNRESFLPFEWSGKYYQHHAFGKQKKNQNISTVSFRKIRISIICLQQIFLNRHQREVSGRCSFHPFSASLGNACRRITPLNQQNSSKTRRCYGFSFFFSIAPWSTIYFGYSSCFTITILLFWNIAGSRSLQSC